MAGTACRYERASSSVDGNKQINFKVMSISIQAETGKYGHPTPTQVNVKATAGGAPDFRSRSRNLYNLLEQTEGTGVHLTPTANAACAWLPGAA
ncbi:hypothetical protein ACNKHX_05120 [Shigella flexneri]